MHNSRNEYFSHEMENGINPEFNYDMSPEFGFEDEYGQNYSSETEYDLSPEFEFGYPPSENEILAELAQEVRDASGKEQLKHVVRKTAKKIADTGDKLLNSPAGKKATDALADIGQKALPKLAKATGNFIADKLDGRDEKAQQNDGDELNYVQFVRFVFQRMADLANSGGEIPVRQIIREAARRHFPRIFKSGSSYSPDKEYGLYNESHDEYADEYETSNQEGFFNEVTELRLASELLNTQSELELDRFLEKLFTKSTNEDPQEHKKGPLGGILKKIAQTALPIAGGIFGGPAGALAGNVAGKLLGKEYEGLSREDKEFEAARNFVRLGAGAARRASRLRHLHPNIAARNAVIHSASIYAPGLLVNKTTNDVNDKPPIDSADADHPDDGLDKAGTDANKVNSEINSGKWYRDRNRIIINIPHYKSF